MPPITYHAYKHPGDHRDYADKPVWNWHDVLIDAAEAAMSGHPEKFHLGQFVPIGAFNDPPFRKHLISFTRGMMIEVELPYDDKMRTDVLEDVYSPVWVAECIHMVGYYVLARWIGDLHGHLFWVHSANAHVHPVGYSEANAPSGYTIAPPHHIYKVARRRGARWLQEQLGCVLHRYTPLDEFDIKVGEIERNKFKVNNRVETPHDDDSFVLQPAIVKKVIGRRVLLEYSKSDIDSADLLNIDNMWRDMNDPLIYPVGFAESVDLPLQATGKYKAHVAAIDKALKEKVKPGDLPYTRHDVKPETIDQGKTHLNVRMPWEAGMVCEMHDRLDKFQYALKPARVLKVLPNGYLQVGPEGSDIINDSLYVHQTSTLLFPCGFAKKHQIPLQGLKDEPQFIWDSFLTAHPAYKMAPDHFFHQASEFDNPFKVGMRLEAIDQNEKLLCPATVRAIKGRLVQISFDGWAEDCDHLYDYRSNELFPCGWGEMVGHALQRPDKVSTGGGGGYTLQQAVDIDSPDEDD